MRALSWVICWSICSCSALACCSLSMSIACASSKSVFACSSAASSAWTPSLCVVQMHACRCMGECADGAPQPTTKQGPAYRGALVSCLPFLSSFLGGMLLMPRRR